MNQLKEEYLEYKQKILGCIQLASEFFNKYEYSHDAEMMQEQYKNLQNGDFSISVVGEFSAGKSTFLNALMGEKILPSFTSETTATVNFLRHKDNASNGEGGCVHYNDGKSQLLEKADLKTISKYVSTDSDVSVAQTISHVDLFLDSKFLEGNVTLVDTPGLNGIEKGHRDITEEQIEKSSACIFLFSSDKPGSKTDFDFITEIRKRVKSIIFVLNKIDCIKSSEGESVEDVVNKLKENYKKIYPDITTIPEIWPISSYEALVARSHNNMDYNGKSNFSDSEKRLLEDKSRMVAFEERLWKFLTHGEKAKAELTTPLQQLEDKMINIRENLKNEAIALSGNVDKDELEGKKLELQNALDSLEDKLKEIRTEIKKDVTYIQKEFLEEFVSEVEQYKNRLENRVKAYSDIEETEYDNIENNIKNNLYTIIHDCYRNYTDDIQNIMMRYNEEITDELNQSLEGNINVKLDNHLELTTLSLGLEEFDKKAEALKAEIDRLEKNAEESNRSVIAAMKKKQEKEKLERELKEINQRKNEYEENSMYYAPEVRHTQCEIREKQWRGGIIGTFADVLFGRKTVSNMYDKTDDTERKNYLSDREKRIKKYETERDEVKKNLKAYDDVDVDTADYNAKNSQERLDKKRQELADFENRYDNEIQNKKDKMLKIRQNEITEYIDDVVKDFRAKARKDFQSKSKVQIEVMSDIIGSSVRKKIDVKKQELDNINKTISAAVEEKNARITVIQQQLEEISEIFKSAFEIKDDIDLIEVDSIKEEDI